nr:GntR family transcriptional regulator [Tepidanaerobacter acetatoxydans]
MFLTKWEGRKPFSYKGCGRFFSLFAVKVGIIRREWRRCTMPYKSFDNYPLSWKPNLDRNSRSLYKTLARQLEEDIANGTLRPGTKLPPQRELADYLDLNVSTISKAFNGCNCARAIGQHSLDTNAKRNDKRRPVCRAV